jgi:hypothetical protein
MLKMIGRVPLSCTDVIKKGVTIANALFFIKAANVKFKDFTQENLGYIYSQYKSPY